MITTLRTGASSEAESQFSRMADMSVKEMKIKANHVANESLESTRRMLQMTKESMNVGVKTMTMLDEQGEKLKNVEREMDQISQDMKQARKNLNELSKFCGICLCPCNRLSDWRKTQRKKGKESKQKVVSSQPSAVRSGQAVSAVSVTPTGPYIKRVTNDAREDEMEENLDQVGGIIGNLKNLALDMGNEIEKQNKTIVHITDKAGMNEPCIDEANQRANKLL